MYYILFIWAHKNELKYAHNTVNMEIEIKIYVCAKNVIDYIIYFLYPIDNWENVNTANVNFYFV